jgi:hypothetical protein
VSASNLKASSILRFCGSTAKKPANTSARATPPSPST